MTNIDDWIQKVYYELTSGGGPLTNDEADMAVKAIQQHCPFKADTAYVEMVPERNYVIQREDSASQNTYKEALQALVKELNDFWSESGARQSAAFERALRATRSLLADEGDARPAVGDLTKIDLADIALIGAADVDRLLGNPERMTFNGQWMPSTQKSTEDIARELKVGDVVHLDVPMSETDTMTIALTVSSKEIVSNTGE